MIFSLGGTHTVRLNCALSRKRDIVKTEQVRAQGNKKILLSAQVGGERLGMETFPNMY